MNTHYSHYLLVLCLFCCGATAAQAVQKIDLSGVWQVKLDSLDLGEKENWAAKKLNSNTIDLPGTLDEAEIGNPNRLKPALNNFVLSNLTRKYQYIGKAWYQKEVNIPQDWKKKNIKLLLERVIWESTVFIDGQRISSEESLVGSHEYDLSDVLSTGKHLLTIRIDNGDRYPYLNVKGDRYPDPINQDMAHGYTNHTQIKWNGILGEISLTGTDSNSPKALRISPDFVTNELQIVFEQPKPRKKNLFVEILDADGNIILSQKVEEPRITGNMVHFSIPTPKKLQVWDEFHPQLYSARITSGGHTISKKFGYRKLQAKNGMLTLNDKRIFLRGNLECVIFPLTGRPPMEKEGWAKLIAQAKNYGLNHLRFHSWCPPTAAFEAADEAGFYLQAELPHWSLKVGEDSRTTDFLRKEADKMLADYGHHPSFILMALGNELQGDVELLNTITAELKKKDDRRLYATTSFSFQKPTGTRPEREDEFFIAQWTDKGWIRGQGVFNDSEPAFNTDYSANSEHIEIPLISHEIGQYSVYPDLREIPKYTGVLEPLNFMAVKNDLEEKGMLDLAADFTQASGKLAAMLYKEEIERALKTPSFDGFQLLQLQDFPGQGTALVGLLNAFWESKGAISAAEFRKFNSPLVPLLRFEKAVYEDGETFQGTIEIANFLEDKKGQTLEWSITDENGSTLAEDRIENINLMVGNNLNLGQIKFPISISKAQQWNIQVKLKNTDFENSWPIWVYPKTGADEPETVLITSSFKEAITALEKGEKVLLNPKPEQLDGVKGRFVPVFWSPVHFPDQPGTMGLLVDHQHSALHDFPTNKFTEWQWWDLCIQSKSVNIEAMTVQPIVRVIDNFVTNRQLTAIFEAKVGEGRLLFSSIDVKSKLRERPVARQLRKSLLNYMGADSFNPENSINASDLKSLFLSEE